MPHQSRAVVSHARLVSRYLWKQVQWEMRRPLTTSLQMERTMSIPQSGLAVFGFVLLICAIHSFWGRRRKEGRGSHLSPLLYRLRMKALHTYHHRSHSSDSLVFVKVSAQVSRLKTVSTEWTFKLYRPSIVKMQFSSFLSFLLLLLAGDVESNPGPLSNDDDVKKVLPTISDKELIGILEIFNKDGCNGIHVAAIKRYLNIIKYLLDEHRCSPLHLAAGNAVIRYLTLDKGCDTMDKNKDGNAPLHVAVLHGHIGVARFFISSSISTLEIIINNGLNTTHIARGHLEYLVDKQGCSPCCLDNTMTKQLQASMNKDGGDIRVNSNYPGIFFFKMPIVEHLTVKCTSISRLEDVGIEIAIPENSLKEPLELSIHPCFSGSFDLPHGYESASPAYLIKHNKKDFLKEVTVKIQHYACLQNEEDCEDMVFLSASSIPQYRESRPVYVFKEIQGKMGRFRPGDQVGEMSLRHFCILKIGKKRKREEEVSDKEVSDTYKDNGYYSARLYRNLHHGIPSQVSAVFCMCICHPIYIQVCDDRITKEYKGLDEGGEARSEVNTRLSSDGVMLSVINGEGWNIRFDKEPAKILKDDIHLPELLDIKVEDCVNYPPKILIYIQPTGRASDPPKLKVIGLDRECYFELPAPKPSAWYQPSVDDQSHTYSLNEMDQPSASPLQTTALRDEIDQHMTACLKIIEEKLTVDINIVRLVSFGLPRSGKTSTLLRLMGEILNILTANKKEQPSTGVVEERGLVIIRNLSTEIATISSGIWSKPESLQEEAGIYNQLLYQVANSDPTRAEEDSATSIEESAASRPHTDVLSGNDRASPIEEDRASSPITDPTKSETMEEDTDEILSAFRESMQAEDWDKVKYLLNDIVLLINTDTGGHAEFLEMHAALVMGPSLYLLFSRLTDQLDSLYKVYYTNEEGVSTDKEDSTLTVEEVLFQALSSIECFSECFLENDRNGAAKRYSNHLKSKALFVGTHRDKVTDQELREKDELLKKRIQNTSFYKSDTIENAYEDQMMLAVNNYDGDQAELDGIRAVLEDIIKSFRKITIPASWLMFSICIRKRKIRTMKLEECVKLAGSLRISSSELQEALWFLHRHAGLILYYPNLEALKDIVICDVQVVFDSVTKLAKETFTFSKFRKRATEIKESGQFSQDDIEKAMSDSTSLIPFDKLVKLLEYLNILTSFIPVSSKRASSSQGVIYFMPSILKSARNDELTVQTSSHDPAPLILQSECGYVPMGIFTYMITSIVSQRLDGWEMIQDPIRKNKVKFYVGDDYDMVTLISRPLYIEVIITRQESESNLQTSTKDLCARIRSVIWYTLETVTSHIYHQLDMKYKYCFECPKHPGKDHLCVLAKEGAKFMECLQNPKRKEPIRLKPVHGVWFGESLSGDVQFRGDIFHIASAPSHQLTADDHDEVCRCLRNLDDEQLIDLGGSLGLNFPRLKRMKSHPADMVCAWLNGEDRVTCYNGKDTRSWKALIETLKDNSQAGIAKDILEYLKKKN